MDKRPLIIGNWKMELSHKAELELVRAIGEALAGVTVKSQVVICPSFVSLAAIREAIGSSKKLELGAQNVFWEERGAFTGQVSLNHIKPFVSWCLLGHSEVRSVVGVTDEKVAASAARLAAGGIRPVVCIGETQEERASEQTVEKVRSQVDALLAGLDRAALVKTVIAYEPIWAIGTGVLPEPDDVSQIVLFIRKHIAARHDQTLAERVTILYGGSVKFSEAAPYIGPATADGVLVGGASVHPKDFIAIIKEVEKAFLG